jgi:hypothetical protein
MLVFLDETFRTHVTRRTRFGVLSRVAFPEELLPSIQQGIYDLRKPYHNLVLGPDDDLKGAQLLRRITFEQIERQGFSYHFNLVEEALQYAASNAVKVFGVVCYNPTFQDFRCADENLLDPTFRYLFERIDRFMKHKYPGRYAKLIFDDRGRQDNEKNAKAITNFFARSTVGLGYDSIVRIPFFAISRGHNYGLQLADIVTTALGLRFQGERRCDRLFRIVRSRMLHTPTVAGRLVSSLKVMRNEKELGGR